MFPPYQPPDGPRSRGKRLERCPQCALSLAVCICASVPTLSLRTELVFVVHHDELHKPTSSGRLLALALGSKVFVRGSPHPSEEVPPFDVNSARVLFPAADAEELAATSTITTLVIPEGNWGQAQRACKRVPALAALPKVVLGDPTRASHALRAVPRPNALPTAEAVLRALEILEGPVAVKPLWELYDRWHKGFSLARAGLI